MVYYRQNISEQGGASMMKNEKDFGIALEIKNLNAFFGPSQALRNVNLSIHHGRTLAMIGPSGCGKSTLLRCLNRLHEETSSKAKAEGEVLMNGKNLYAAEVDPVQVRQRMGMVFQKPNPFPGLSIYENVVSGLMMAGIRDKKLLQETAEKSLQGAFLWNEVKDRLKKPATGLSGGQQQRLCIARALAMNPEILLMDEPTSALDPIATAGVEELIKELQGRMTLVVVTHNMQQARRISDETAFLYMGELIEVSETNKLFDSPAHEKTKAYLSGAFS